MKEKRCAGFSLGRLHIWGQVQGDRVLMGGLMRGDIDLKGGPNFDRLYHKLKVLLMLSCNYMMQFIGYNSNPSGTKGFGTHTKHQGGGVKKDPPQYLKNEKCYKPETFGGVRSIL